MAVRTCLFDLGNVLVTFCHDQMCQQIGDLLERPAEVVREVLFDRQLQWEFECGRMTPEDFHQNVDRHFGTRTAFADFRHAASAIFTPTPGMQQILAELKSAGIRLVLLSNTCVSHFEHVRDTFDLLDFFDDFVLSFRVGALKPQAAIYEKALSLIQCDPADCFYTDDIPEYIAAAHRFGIDAEVFQSAATTRRELTRRGALT